MARHSLRDAKTGRFISKAEYQRTVGQAKKIEKAFQKLTQAVKTSKKSSDELYKSIRKAIKVIVDDAPKANTQIRQMDVGIKRLTQSVKMLIKPTKAVFDIFMKMTRLTFGGILKLFGISTLLSKLGSLQGLNAYNYRGRGIGTTATRLRGLERTEAIYGTGGDLTNVATQMQENVYNPSKWASLQTLTGVDMNKYHGMDSVDAMWKMFGDVRSFMRSKGITNAGSVEYQAIFKQFAENLGMSQELFNNLLKGNNLEKWMKDETKATKISEGQIKIEQEYTRTMQRLQDTMQRFAVTFAGPILKLSNKFITELNRLLKTLGTKKSQEAMDMFVNSIIDFTEFMVTKGIFYLNEFIEWFKNDGINDVKAWFQFFKDRMNDFTKWYGEGGNVELKALWQQVKNIASAIEWVAMKIIPTFASGLMDLIATLPGTGIKKIGKHYVSSEKIDEINQKAQALATKNGYDIGKFWKDSASNILYNINQRERGGYVGRMSKFKESDAIIKGDIEKMLQQYSLIPKMQPVVNVDIYNEGNVPIKSNANVTITAEQVNQ